MRRERLDRWVRENPVIVDGILVLALLLFTGTLSLATSIGSTSDRAVWALLLTVPLAWRRTKPTASTAVVYLAAFGHWATGIPALPSDLCVLVALYSVAAYGSRRVSRLGFGFALLGALLLSGRLGAGTGSLAHYVLGTIIATTLGATVVVTVWVAGSLRGTRRAYLDALVERAHRLEIEREQQAQLAAAAERARIAREMHDVVAHSLSVIIAQADGGRYAAQTAPASAVDALEVISQTGRRALTDMRRLLGVLRAGESDGRDPQPGLDGVADLVESVRSSGVPVTLTELGQPRPVGAGLGLAAYRIIQEALTNVLKHAGPQARATVQICWEPAGLWLRIQDDGRGASATSDGRGQGVTGMRERARLFGGDLVAAPAPGGGFLVEARLAYSEPGG